MTAALTNQTTGLASIANQQALSRVNTQITALQGGNANAATGSGNGASSSASRAPTSSATNLLSTATASVLLSGQIPSGSILSILA
jgi:hypothetical protein